MNLLNTRYTYGLVSRALHWIIVLAILAQWLLSEADENSSPIPGSSLNAAVRYNLQAAHAPYRWQ